MPPEIAPEVAGLVARLRQGGWTKYSEDDLADLAADMLDSADGDGGAAYRLATRELADAEGVTW